MKNWSKIPLANFSAVILGIILTFAFAPYEIFPLAVISTAGLVGLLLKTSSSKKAFWLGFYFGLGLFGAGVYWVFNSIHDIGGVPSALAILITSALVGFLSLYTAFACYLTKRFFSLDQSPQLICAFPAIWVFLEILRGSLFTGFPWLYLGYSQTNSPLKGFAPLFSVYGVSLAVLVTSTLLVNAVIKYKQKDFKNLYLSLFTIISIWIAGSLFSLIPWTKPQGESISVGLVQGNIPQLMKWSPEHLRLSFDRYVQLTQPLWGKDKLIIWPEAAIPMPLQMVPNFINNMDARAKSSGSNLILGIPMRSEDGPGYFNAVVSVGSDLRVYRKRRLVPFGEYTPFKDYFSRAINFLNLPLPDDIVGSDKQAPFIVNNTKILMSVCYEIAFPELMKTSDKNVGFILTVTNDAWFGRSNAQAQHLQMAAMRAIELARPALFVSNDGITAIISPQGKIESEAPAHVATVLNGNVQPMYGITPWMYNGLDPIVFIELCLLYAAIRNNTREKKNNENQQHIFAK